VDDTTTTSNGNGNTEKKIPSQVSFSVSESFYKAIESHLSPNQTLSEYLRETVASAISYDLAADPVKPRGKASSWPTPEHAVAYNVLKQRLENKYTKECLALVVKATNDKQRVEATNTLAARLASVDQEARDGVEAEIVAMRARKEKRANA
jgi:hypothetical protein